MLCCIILHGGGLLTLGNTGRAPNALRSPVQEGLGDSQQRLENRLRDLTKSQQRIATYPLAHHDEAAFLPAAGMAKRLDVSEDTMAQRRSVCLDRRSKARDFRAMNHLSE
jgi:hypothetical protein